MSKSMTSGLAFRGDEFKFVRNSGHRRELEPLEERDSPISADEISLLDGFAFPGAEVLKRIKVGRSGLVLRGEPDLIPAKERRIEQARVVRREDKLGSIRVGLGIIEEVNQFARDISMKTGIELVHDQDR